MNHFDLLVIGAGSAGLAVAQRAAKLGKKVALIEKDTIGGTCVNLGCVPKKMMWYAGQTAEALELADSFGFTSKSKFNFKTLVTHREKFIKTLNKIYADRVKKLKITYVQGQAKFYDAKTLLVNKQKYTAKHIVIATGTQSNIPKIKGAELAIESDGFFALTQLPKQVAIIGAGYIALELAFILNQLGSKVKLLIRKNKPLRNFDNLIAENLQAVMKEKGIEVLTYHEAEEIKTSPNNKLSICCQNKKTLTQLDTVIFAIGRSPHTENLNLIAAGVKINEKGFIITDKGETTTISHIYAIGDVAGKKLLTPVAVAAGRHLAERLFGKNKNTFLDYQTIPTALFTHPSAASVGLTEQEAIQKYGADKINIDKTKFNSLYYALSPHKIPSAMKIISLKKNDILIGCHLVGINSEEIIQGFAVAMKMGATKQDFANTIGIHPTSGEELLTI